MSRMMRVEVLHASGTWYSDGAHDLAEMLLEIGSVIDAQEVEFDEAVHFALANRGRDFAVPSFGLLG